MIRKMLPILGGVICFSQISLSQSANEVVAYNWINSHFSQNQAKKFFELKKESNQSSLSGETFRYGQFINNVPVYGVNVAVHVSPDSAVTYHAGDIANTVSNLNTIPDISADKALKIAVKSLGIEETLSQENTKLYVYNDTNGSKLVYRVTTISKTLNGFWETMVDAHTSQIISQKDIAHYCKDHDEDPEKGIFSTTEKTMVQVSGMIFNPDPLSVSGESYGGNFVDNDDMTNSYLDDARTQVTFKIENSENGVYKLKGEYAEIKDIQNPATGLFEQNSPDFSFTRDQDGFEAVNAYYHIDKNMRYINESLQIPLKSIFNNGVIFYDPHAFNGADNSSYGGGILKFGIGGVDDAEDADVIVHELGHGIHEWLIHGNISQVEGLSEGFGDYWAQSYSRSLNKSNSSRTNSSYNNLFKWDGHNEYWSGRVTNYDGIYPEGLTGKIHKDGQIFSSALMEIWEQLGKELTDKIVLEGMAMTTNTTNQPEAAAAIKQAAIDMGVSCGNIEIINQIFNSRGYGLEGWECAKLSVAETDLSTISLFPNPARETLAFKNLNKDYKIAVYNLMGQRILENVVNRTQNTLNVSGLSKGMYIVTFNGYTTNFKFIKE